MVELQAVWVEVELLRAVYAAFNRREIETVLALMSDDVDWPNGWEGGRLRVSPRCGSIGNASSKC